MKRIMVFWLVLFLPIFVFAKEYEDVDINMKLDLNDDYIVLTRHNLKNNPSFGLLNVTEEYMDKVMETNNIYFDIIKSDLSYEILVVVPKTKPQYKDLREASEDELKELKNVILKDTGDKMPIIYKNEYPFVVVNYKDKDNYNIINYYTVIDSRGYNIQLQKLGTITEKEELELMNVVDGIEFIEKKEIKEETKEPFNYMIILYGAIIKMKKSMIRRFLEEYLEYR